MSLSLFSAPPLSSAFPSVVQILPLGWQDGCQHPQASVLPFRAKAIGPMLALSGQTWVTCSSLSQSLWFGWDGMP